MGQREALRQPAEDCCEHGNENRHFGTGLPAHGGVTPQAEAVEFLRVGSQRCKTFGSDIIIIIIIIIIITIISFIQGIYTYIP